jgi:transcriptional regulator with XRE-family HTH domain
LKLPRLREQRELRGMTQAELAEESGRSARSISGYEAGADARPNTARLLAEALGVSIADLLEEQSPKAPSSSPKAPELQVGEERRGEARALGESIARSLRGVDACGEIARGLQREWAEEVEMANERGRPLRFPRTVEMSLAAESLSRDFAENISELAEGMRELGMVRFSDYFHEAQQTIAKAWVRMRGMQEALDLASRKDDSLKELQRARARYEEFFVGEPLDEAFGSEVAEFARSEALTTKDEQ